jgi:kynurenine formamidase
MGDENNISSVEIHSHYGTHVDAPYHFDKNGAKITDFDVNHYYFTKPFVVEIPKEEDEPILEEDLKSFEKSISGGDILLIRTGFSRYRQDHDKYLCNPYMDLSAANYLMDHFPELRGLGIDCISILNRKFRPMGIETHRILLGYYDKKKFLLLFEDVNLDFGDRILTEIIALPLFIKDAEAFPCTMIAR